MHLLHLLIYFGTDNKAYYRLARYIIRNMLTQEWQKHFKAYRHLLMWTYDKFSFGIGQKWSDAMLLAMSWAHTEHLFRVFIATKASYEWIYQTFQLNDSNSLLLTQSTNIRVDVAYPDRLTYLEFLIAGLNYSFGENSVLLVDRTLSGDLMELAIIIDTNALFPKTDFLSGSFLYMGHDHSPFANIFPIKQYETLLSGILDALEINNSDFGNWAILFGMISDYPAPLMIRNRSIDFFKKVDFLALFEQDALLGYVPISLAVAQARHLKDESLTKYLRKQVLVIVTSLKKKYECTKISESQEILLLDLVFQLAKAYHESDVLSEFVAIMGEIINIFGELPPRMYYVMQKMYLELPATDACIVALSLIRNRGQISGIL